MNVTTTTATTKRRMITAVAGGLLAAGVLAGGLAGGTAIAGAQPADTGQCSSMAMPGVQAAPAPNRMTRAGQVSASNASATAESMPTMCQAGGR